MMDEGIGKQGVKPGVKQPVYSQKYPQQQGQYPGRSAVSQPQPVRQVQQAVPGEGRRKGPLFYLEIIVPLVVIIMLIIVGGLIWNWWSSPETVEETGQQETVSEQAIPEVTSPEPVVYEGVFSLQGIIASGDEVVCFDLKDPFGEIRSKCVEGIAVKKAGQGMCAGLDYVGDSNECYTYVAIAKKDVSFCDDVKDYNDTRFTKDNCISSVAGSKSDKSICEMISDPGIKVVCISDVGIASGDEELCSVLEDEDSRDGCVTEVAVKNNDSALCEKMEGDWRNYCYVSLASHNLDMSLCDKINVEEGYASKDTCRLVFAASSHDVSLCEEIKRTDQRYACYVNYAEENGDYSVCGKIPLSEGLRDSPMSRDSCYYGYAVRASDPNGCYMISDDSDELNVYYTLNRCLNDVDDLSTSFVI